MHWKIQIVNISITRDMVSHIRGRYDCISERIDCALFDKSTKIGTEIDWYVAS